MNKVDSKTLKVVNIDAASRVPMLAAGKVQSIDQFLMSEPAIRRAVTTAKPVCLFAGDYGLEIYANSLGVSEDFLAKNPEVVKKFTRAALKGWKDALANPEEAAKIEIQYVKALDPQIVVEEIAILKRIAITPDVREERLRLRLPRAHEEHRRLHQQEHRGVRRQADGGSNLSPGISAGDADQAIVWIVAARRDDDFCGFATWVRFAKNGAAGLRSEEYSRALVSRASAARRSRAERDTDLGPARDRRVNALKSGKPDLSGPSAISAKRDPSCRP